MNPDDFLQFPAEYSVPLRNLSAVRTRMDSLQTFLSESVNNNSLISNEQMGMVCAEISSAIQQTIVNGAALLACSQSTEPPIFAAKPLTSQSTEPPIFAAKPLTDPPDRKNIPPSTALEVNKGRSNLEVVSLKEEDKEEYGGEGDCDIVELDAVELLAEHVHFCDVCGKGFKRDANLRMHMRAHGNQFKTPEALAKPDKSSGSGSGHGSGPMTRFSCPYEGCNRNKQHKKFRPLKSVICVRNHFKRSHCPKMYSCNRCHKKSFSVVADLKSHLKHCGESRWKCSCGTSFSRKDKLFGHMALFEGHMPAVVAEEEEENEEERAAVGAMEVEEEEVETKREDFIECYPDNGFFDGLLDGFDSMEGYTLQDLLNSPTNGFL